MKILVVTDTHPLPSDDGMRLHLASLLPRLAQDHEVTLVSLVGPGDTTDRSALVALGVTGWTGVARRSPTRRQRIADEVPALLRQRPVLVQQVRTSGLPQAMAARLRADRPDVVHLQPGWLADLARQTQGVPAVAVPLDASAPNLEAQAQGASGLRRLLVRREQRRLVRFERTEYAACAGVVVVSQQDADLLHGQDPRLHPVVVPNGVEPGPWQRPVGAVRERDLVVLTGALSYPPNVDAARFAALEVLPRLHALRPTARLALVGRDPSPEVLALRSPRVEVTGTVPDLAPWLWRAGAYLCPMRTGTGIKNKLLEALAAGCPIVATPYATGGLSVRHDRDLLLAQDPDGLAAALDAVLGDAAVADRLSQAAVRVAAAQSWERAARQLTDVYHDAVVGAARRAPG